MGTKSQSGEGLIKSLEDFKQVVTFDDQISLPNGKTVTFRLHAISPATDTRIQQLRDQTRPEKPEQPTNDQGEFINPPSYLKKLKDYRAELREWNDLDPYWYLYFGWAKPEQIEVPGKNDLEQVIQLYKQGTVAGVAIRLSKRIIALSMLRQEDVDFSNAPSDRLS